jgi:hypothetical protein
LVKSSFGKSFGKPKIFFEKKILIAESFETQEVPLFILPLPKGLFVLFPKVFPKVFPKKTGCFLEYGRTHDGEQPGQVFQISNLKIRSK